MSGKPQLTIGPVWVPVVRCVPVQHYRPL